MKRLLLCVLTALLVTATASAFDHNRRGFVAGIGLGFSPDIAWGYNDLVMPTNSGRSGLGAHALFGLGLGEHNLIATEWNAARYSSSVLNESVTSTGCWQYIISLSWYHYYGETGKSFFTVLGVGPYLFETTDVGFRNGGGAVMAGAGYEFRRHMQIGVYYVVGDQLEWQIFSKGDLSRYGCHHLSVLLTVMGY